MRANTNLCKEKYVFVNKGIIQKGTERLHSVFGLGDLTSSVLPGMYDIHVCGGWP